MSSPLQRAGPEAPGATAPVPEVETERDQISQNLSAVFAFFAREELKVTRSQKFLESISRYIGHPAFLAVVLLIVAMWMLSNSLLQEPGELAFDPPPHFWLQGLCGLGALLTTIVVLSKQNRLAKLAEQRAHLDLKVTLLTEQKVAKLIDLLEELRRDLPNVRDRHDPVADALQQSMNPVLVLAALDERHGGNAAAATAEVAHGQTASADAGAPAPPSQPHRTS